MKKLVRFIGIMCFLQFILFYSCSNEAEEVNEKHSKAGKADKHIEKTADTDGHGNISAKPDPDEVQRFPKAW